MSKETKISWADHTGNPWIGCTPEHTGCLNCYARTVSENKAGKTPGPWALWGNGKDRLVTKGFWHDVFAWAKAARKAGVRRTLFASMMDPLDPEVYERTESPEGVAARRTFDAYMRVLEQVAASPGMGGLVPLLLTKRPRFWARIPEHVRSRCWLIYSASDQATLDAGMPHLLAAEGFAGLGLSLEPLVGEIRLRHEHFWPNWDKHFDPEGMKRGHRGVRWVIIGGESGPRARPCDLAWIRSLVRQCREAGVKAFCKQLGARSVDAWSAATEWRARGMPVQVLRDSEAMTVGLRHKAGADPEEWPEDLRVQEWPGGLR